MNAMKAELKKIISGYGLGELKFGSTRDEVKALLGEPDAVECESNSDDEDDVTESWHYDSLELSMSFDQEEDWRLVTFAVTSDFYTFEDESFIGMSKSDLESSMEKLDVEDLDVEINEDKTATHELYFSEELALNFWVEDDKVTEVQWSLLFIDEDTIDWPE